MKKIYFFLSALFLSVIAISQVSISPIHGFGYIDGSPTGAPTLAGNKVYGMLNSGGRYGYGAIYSTDTNGLGYKVIFSFGAKGGSTPVGVLTISGGKIYGETSAGGTGTKGVVFSIDTSGNNYKDLFNFSGNANGTFATGYLTLEGNTLYGATYQGGAHNMGNLFSIDTNGTNYKDMFDFSSSTGIYPMGSLVPLGSKLYGLLSGVSYLSTSGYIFSIDTTGANYKAILSFVNTNDSSGPNGTLTLAGNQFYGIASSGAHQYGAVFRVDTNGKNYTDIFIFSVANGSYAWGPLTYLNNKLYGTTAYGGTKDSGTIFSVDTNGSGFTSLFSFNGANGKRPSNGLTPVGNKFFSTVSNGGGAFGAGNLFSIDTNGAAYTTIHTYSVTEGKRPLNDVILFGNKFYGTTQEGGAYNYGTIFSVDTDGNNFITLHDFNINDGYYPNGALTIVGPKLYGMAPYDGTGFGTLFCIDSNGANFKKIVTFNGTDGRNAFGTLLYDGYKLYGVTEEGGTGCGNVFSVDTNGANIKNLHVFGNAEGCAPWGKLLLSGEKLFGVTVDQSGADGNGIVYSVDTDGTHFNMIMETGTDSYPNGSLILSGKTLYGMCDSAFHYGYGYVYSVDTGGHAAYDLLDFDITNGQSGYGTLTMDGPLLYGMTYRGGANGKGLIFSLDTNGTNYTDMYDFKDTTGTNPWGDLTLIGRNFYGMTSAGGLYGSGIIFGFTNPFTALVNQTATINCNGQKTAALSTSTFLGVPPYTYLWSTGATTSSVSGLGAGTYTVTITDSTGAVATRIVTIVQPDTLKLKGYVSAADSGCDGVAVVTAQGGTMPYHYSWAAGGQLTDTIKNQCPGIYCCTVTDTNGCVQNICDTVICHNLYKEPLCIVTIDTATNKSMVIWGRTDSPPAGSKGSYNIYKFNGGSFVLLHSQPIDSLSEFIDTASNPAVKVQTYRLTTTDSCSESAPSPAHTSILLTTTAGTNSYKLSWTQYVGFTPLRYRIFRGPSMSTLVQIDSVPNTVLAYVDSFPPINSFYVAEAVNPSTVCSPSKAIMKHNPQGLPLLTGAFSNGFNAGLLGVGINTISGNSIHFNVHPNPASDVVSITTSVPLNGNISITNVFGQVVYTDNITQGEANKLINIASFPQGVYIIKLESNGQTAVSRFVKL